MKIRFMEQAWEDYLHWQENDRAALCRLNKLILDIQREPYDGIGQPEALRHELSGYWSRRIDRQNRLVYCVENDTLVILQCRHHY